MKQLTKKVLALSVAGLSVFGGLSAIVAADSFDTTDMTTDQFESSHGMQMHERMMDSEDVVDALELNDYNAFITATGHEISEERFEEIVEMHSLHENVRDAIDAEDYDAWVSAVEQLPHADEMNDVISEDDFESLIEIHNARENGATRDEVQVFSEELGMKMPKMHKNRSMNEANNGSFGAFRDAKENGASRDDLDELADELGIERRQGRNMDSREKYFGFGRK